METNMSEIDYDKAEEELDAQIEQMFNGQSDDDQGEPAPAPEQDEGTAEQTPEPEPEEEAVAKSRYDNAVKAMNRAQQEAASLRKEVEQLQQTVQELQQAQQAPSPQPGTDDSDLQTLLDDYPDIVGPLIKRNKILEDKLSKFEESLNGIKNDTATRQQREQQEANQRHLNAIYAAHPDADDLVQDDSFQSWVSEQPPIIQLALKQGTATDVIYALNKYKDDNKIPVKTDRTNEARSAATPTVARTTQKPTSQKPQFTREQIAKMSMEQFAKNEALIDEALASGNIY